MSDYQQLPSNLPVPQDDGAADHLPGAAMPPLVLHDTSGNEVALDQLGPARTVVYIYPLSGRPGVELPAGWDTIPGARGCTPEACGSASATCNRAAVLRLPLGLARRVDGDPERLRLSPRS